MADLPFEMRAERDELHFRLEWLRFRVKRLPFAPEGNHLSSESASPRQTISASATRAGETGAWIQRNRRSGGLSWLELTSLTHHNSFRPN